MESTIPSPHQKQKKPIKTKGWENGRLSYEERRTKNAAKIFSSRKHLKDNVFKVFLSFSFDLKKHFYFDEAIFLCQSKIIF